MNCVNEYLKVIYEYIKISSINKVNLTIQSFDSIIISDLIKFTRQLEEKLLRLHITMELESSVNRQKRKGETPNKGSSGQRVKNELQETRNLENSDVCSDSTSNSSYLCSDTSSICEIRDLLPDVCPDHGEKHVCIHDTSIDSLNMHVASEGRQKSMHDATDVQIKNKTTYTNIFSSKSLHKLKNLIYSAEDNISDTNKKIKEINVNNASYNKTGKINNNINNNNISNKEMGDENATSKEAGQNMESRIIHGC